MSKNRVTKEKIKQALETGETMRFKDSARAMIDILEELGVEEYREIDTNGWDCDFWASYTYEDNYYHIWGCAFDGDVSIERMNEEDIEDDDE